MKKYVVIVVAALFLCLSGTPARAQQEFSSESKSWTFTMPAGWQVMSAEQVAKLNKQYKLRNPDHPSRVVAGFMKSGGLFAYPEVVLQVLDADMSQLSWPALQRMCTQGGDDSPGAESAALIADLIDSSGADSTRGYQFDPGAHQVSGKGDLVLDDQTQVETACRTFLHSGGAIQLTGLDYKTNTGGAQRSLDAFAGSFHIASGHAFAPAPDAPPKPRRSTSSYSSGGPRYGYYGGGGFVIVIVGVIVRLALRAWIRGS